MCHSNLSEIDSYSVKIFFVYMKKNKILLGKDGETLAENYLTHIGMKIIAKNYHTSLGEIDLVAIDKKEIVFIEVKTRTKSIENAKSSISYKKQQKIKMSANIFLTKHENLQDMFTRFDVILILANKNNYYIKHIKDAFR